MASSSPDRGEPVLFATGVSRSFGDTIALRPTTLTVHRGERVVLIGPSGCGKSTLLRVMVGLIASDSGSVVLDGETVTPTNVEQLRRERMGYVIQSGGLFPHLTARQNVALLSEYMQSDAKFVADRMEELCALVRLPAAALDRFPNALSGGQRQRVALMRALFTKPDVLFLDEPLGAVDPMTRADLQKELADIFDAVQTTVVMVTHDLAEAAFFGDIVVLMKSGEIVQAAPLEEMAKAPASPFVDEFLTAHRPFIPPSLQAVST